MKLRRTRKLLAGAGMISMLLGALMVVAPTGAGAQDHVGDPPGNNGTVKIDGRDLLDGPGHSGKPNDPDEDDPDTDPHVTCGFELEFFGFDEGQYADIVVRAHPPTGDGEVLIDDRVVISDDGPGGSPDLDAVLPYDLNDELALFAHDIHGWHVKLNLTIYDADGSVAHKGEKHKVFWVEGCESTNPTHSVSLAKTNNANGDSAYSDDETATSAGAAVPFRVVVTNTGTGELTLASLVDTWPGQAQPLNLLTLSGLTCTGAGDAPVTLAVGTKLAAGSVTTCLFTLSGYSPAAGGSLTNTVTVDTDETGPTGDTSIVRSPATGPAHSVTVAKTNNANGDSTYSDSEQAPSAGAAVPFRVVITNTGTGELTLASLADTWPGQAQPLNLLTLSGITCTGAGGAPVTLAVGTTLAAGSITTCLFTLTGYSPGAGGSLTNTVTVDTDETTPTGDSSVVTSPGGQITIPECIDNPNTPLNECAPPPPPPVVITDVCPQTPGRQTLVESCVEVLPDEVTPPTTIPPTTTPPVTATPPTRPEVRGDVVTRTLPRTGGDGRNLAAFGAGLLLLGAGLVASSRVRFRDIG